MSQVEFSFTHLDPPFSQFQKSNDKKTKIMSTPGTYPAFTIEDIDQAPNELVDDDLVIEDIPDLEDRIHDQLPSVEEYKASVDHTPSTSKKFWSRILISTAVVVAIIGVSQTSMLIGYVAGDGTIEPPSHRLDEVTQFLFENNVSNLPNLKDQNTDQHKAAAFVADGDAYRMELIDENSNRFAERYILALIFYHTNGQDWLHRLHFLSATDHCNWWHKYTNTKGKEVRQGVKCDSVGRVIELNLSYNGLKANSIPEEIQFLAKMETLHLYSNPNLSGYIPEVFQKMPNLKGIGIMNTAMGGTLPQWIGTMTQLTTLALSNNDLRGSVPASIQHLKNLKLLALDGNQFEGDVATFKDLTKLEGLFLDHNALLGSISAFENLSNLISLDVSHNHLYGTLPVGLLNHPTLEVLDVSSNSFDGDLPDDILENDKLEYFSAADNSFAGTLTVRFGFVKNLKHLDVSDNQIGGTIPDTLSELTALRYLSTSHNPFESQKMLDLSKMTHLVDLSMKNNKLRGPIPSNIGTLKNLILLDLAGNWLTGSIPANIGGLSNLRFLLLNRNKLSGDFPKQMTWLHRLQVLLLDKNDFNTSAQQICNADMSPNYFIADCYPGSNGEKPEVECRCCTQCCMDLDYECNNKEWSSNVDLQAEYGYRRDSYKFSIREVPVNESDNQDGDPNQPSDPNLQL
jgi:Leucine-rich repeat (LRR) protein